MSAAAPDVSIVVPNYMGARLLPRTLSMLREALREEALDVEVLLSDDASTDGSAATAGRDWPDLRVLHAERNGGFGSACNHGAQAARAPVLFFLNSDAHVTRGFLAPLLAHLRDPAVFSVMPLLVDRHGRPQKPVQVSVTVKRGVLRLVHPEGLDRLAGADGADALRALGTQPTLYAAGAALLVRRDRFLELGGFSDMLAPFYYEDLDLGWRAWRRGWRSLIEPSVTVQHEGAGTISATCDARAVRALRKRNRTLVLWRNTLDNGTLLRRHALAMPMHQLGRLIYGDASSLAGLRAAWRLRDAVAAHRATERRAARRSDVEILAPLDAARRRIEARLAGTDATGAASRNGVGRPQVETGGTDA